MAIQVRNDVIIRQLVKGGVPKLKDSGIIVKNTGATKDIPNGTVLAKDPATNLWEPILDVTATDGTAVPRGIYIGDTIPVADVKAANVTNCNIIVGGPISVDDGLLLFESGTVALDDNITALKLTVEDALAQIGIFIQSVDFISPLENS